MTLLKYLARLVLKHELAEMEQKYILAKGLNDLHKQRLLELIERVQKPW